MTNNTIRTDRHAAPRERIQTASRQIPPDVPAFLVDYILDMDVSDPEDGITVIFQEEGLLVRFTCRAVEGLESMTLGQDWAPSRPGSSPPDSRRYPMARAPSRFTCRSDPKPDQRRPSNYEKE